MSRQAVFSHRMEDRARPPQQPALIIQRLVGNRTEPSALQKKLRGVSMPSTAYFRRQADICLRLAVIASDEEVSNRLIMMAREYTAKGDALTRQSGGDALPADDRPVPAERDAAPAEWGGFRRRSLDSG
jgi:hypothetical protein